jgi:hypothetical protein
VLNIIAIKTKDKVFISDNIEGKGYFNSALGDKLFDGEKSYPSYVSGWYWTPKIPQTVERIIAPLRINKRYELREQYPVTDVTPKVIDTDYIDEDSEFYNVRGLYELKYDLTEESKEDVEFQITILDEIDNFEPVKSEFQIKYNLIDMLKTHPILLPTKPCKLTCEESYKIIRQYIKENINLKCAKITSDYDFCFTVKKNIELAESIPYQVDEANEYNYGRKRKPKMVTRYRKYRDIEIYNVAPKSYQSYNIVKPFEGKSYEDMIENMNKFLEELIEEINRPYIDCPHCNGMGVIIKTEK